MQTTEHGRERKAKQLAQRGTISGIGARVGRTMTLEIRGSDAVRARDIQPNLTGEQAAALARAENDEDVRQSLRRVHRRRLRLRPRQLRPDLTRISTQPPAGKPDWR
ncbi:hypothetical protein ACFZDG_27130 [Kitasatospora xanthocidica]|uniref:hypothetical protein n=1 Tax=Kitasatospora xanthocidica TaxID=83382 RepID=UPI0036EE32AF